ncbi:peptide chain release factor N(5)-glutamine methyltransferase [Polaromonas sp. YR568]|uniref:peptide chain release factor N(5)-glutamine methyltransferase n=1 Tax=Polaromonas sp. YR568 TaxID=1855301 RepID=UPI00398C027F
MNPPTCAHALAAAQAQGLDRLDAQLLLLHALGKPGDARAWLLAHDTDVLPEKPAEDFRAMCARRAAGEPLAYIVGSKEFFGLTLQVDARVLVPRPDTETLVDWALECLKAPAMPPKPAVLDLGTGSGAIALAIAYSLRATAHQARVVAVDASADALDVARDNAGRLGLSLDFIQSHWLKEVGEHFHLILSNPPYIASADPHLEALAYEPLTALAAGEDGLDDIREIVRQAPGHLLAGGWLLLEHGYDQAEAVCALLAQEGFVQVQSRLDLAGIARCSGGLWPGGQGIGAGFQTAG